MNEVAPCKGCTSRKRPVMALVRHTRNGEIGITPSKCTFKPPKPGIRFRLLSPGKGQYAVTSNRVCFLEIMEV